MRNDNAAIIVVFQSMPCAPRSTATGSCGFGCTGGGATNWKRNVTSPTTTLPRESSVNRTWYAPCGERRACPRSTARSEIPVGSATRPVIAVEEVQVVLVADELEEPERGGKTRAADHEQILFVRSHGDVDALLDDALLDHPAALHDADAQNFRARRSDGPHHGRHLPGAT